MSGFTGFYILSGLRNVKIGKDCSTCEYKKALLAIASHLDVDISKPNVIGRLWDVVTDAPPQLGDTRIRNGQKETYVKWGKSHE